MPLKDKKIAGLEYNLKELYPYKKTLSSTQYLDYLESPEEFYIRWVLGVRQAETPAVYAGKVFSACYADRSLKPSDFKIPPRTIHIFTEALKLLPPLPKGRAEYPLRARFKGWSLRASLDGCPREGYIIENKTGLKPWTQERADESPQVTFMAAVHFLKFGKVPDRIQLNWVHVSNNAKKVVQTFYTKRNKTQTKELLTSLEYVLKAIGAEAFNSEHY